MALVVLILLIGVPILEIAVFIEVGGLLGLFPTIALVVLPAIAGTALLRWQGLATLSRAQQGLERGVLPVAEVLDGLCLLLAGVLLLTPGFVTDAAGLVLFVPAFRRHLVRMAGRWLVASGRVHGSETGTGGANDGGNGPVIEGEFEVQDDRPDPPRARRSVVPPGDP